MDRVRARVKDERVLALVKAFLKAGVLTELREHPDTLKGTRAGSPPPRTRAKTRIRTPPGSGKYLVKAPGELRERPQRKEPGVGCARAQRPERRLLADQSASVHRGGIGKVQVPRLTGEPRQPRRILAARGSNLGEMVADMARQLLKQRLWW